ncbi:histidine--tRNA ligase [Candidatus Peregrinibacteria bacterium]|nr:MAG: histidine--tRNA ligase [Candidatus Peregrinibacteria bacterium]
MVTRHFFIEILMLHQENFGDDKVIKFQSPRGMHDILPEDHDYFTVVKKAVRHRCRQAAFRRISTPVMEDAGVFDRSLGAETDVLQKEMYRLTMGDNTYALRPEGTAGICRAYLEHGMASWPQPVQLYYIEPNFRHDRPQKGRYRQFFQYGVEVLGGRDPSLDAQIILLASKILEDLLVRDRFTLQINTIGTAENRKAYENALRDYFLPKKRNLSEDSQQRIDSNPLRILDSKDEDDKILAELAPKFEGYLDDEAKEYFEKVRHFLDQLGIQYEINQKLVRGLDYYCDTVFEFIDSDGLTVCGGGRYDGLMEMLGGEPTPGFGFAAGVERLALHLKDAGVVPPEKDNVDIYVACIGDPAKGKAMRLISDLHDMGLHVRGAIGKASLKNQLRMADKFGARWTLILGDVEVRENIIILRDMKEGVQERIPFDGILHRMNELLVEQKPDTWKMGE